MNEWYINNGIYGKNVVILDVLKMSSNYLYSRKEEHRNWFKRNASPFPSFAYRRALLPAVAVWIFAASLSDMPSDMMYAFLIWNKITRKSFR